MDRAGQVLIFPSPLPDKDPLVIENPRRQVQDPCRYGMNIHAGDVDGDGRADLLVGAPRHDVEGVKDAGYVFLFWGPDFKPEGALVKARRDPEPRKDDILGFRTRMGNVMGDSRPELIVSSLANAQRGHPMALIIWDGARLNEKHVVLPAMPGASDHYIQGISIAQLDHTGYEELILGDPKYDEAGKKDVGRIVIASFE
jgi:hypothetical protein